MANSGNKSKRARLSLNQSSEDQILSAIAAHIALDNKVADLGIKIDKKESQVKKRYGIRPFGLIRWREWLIGGSEIERVRNELIARGMDKKTIAKEYADARKRYAEHLRKMEEWDERAGLKPIRDEFERLIVQECRAFDRLLTMRPTSVAGAAALAKWLAKDMALSERPEQRKVVLTLAKALKAMPSAA